MLTRLFRRDRPLALFLLPLFLLALWPGGSVDGPVLAGTVQGMPLQAPVRWLFATFPGTAPVVGILLAFGLAHRLDRTANDAELFDHRNHLPALLLPTLLALWPNGLAPGPAFLGAWPMLWALTRLWGAIGRTDLLSRLFDAGLLLGIAGLFYLPYAFLVVVLWATLAVNRPFIWREYVLPFFGMAVMLLLGWGACRFIGPALWDPVGSLTAREAAPVWNAPHWLHGLLLTTLLCILALAAAVSYRAAYARSVMRVKNMRASLLAFAFAMGLLALFAWWLDGRVPPVLLAVPAAVLVSFPLLQARTVAWAEVGLWGLLALGLWGRWG